MTTLPSKSEVRRTEGRRMAAAGKKTPGDPQKIRLATVWLGGCSGCHMSFLDLDERLFDARLPTSRPFLRTWM